MFDNTQVQFSEEANLSEDGPLRCLGQAPLLIILVIFSSSAPSLCIRARNHCSSIVELQAENDGKEYGIFEKCT